MRTAAFVVVVLVALLHVGFLVLEMFFWTKPVGRRTFGLSPELARQTRRLAANQGLYNGFLAAGLVWGLFTDQPAVLVFFLLCVVVAGVFGAVTVHRIILLVQALPAAVALLLLFLARG